MEQIPFVLVSHPRSGTHMLRSALDSHPQVSCVSEIFNPDGLNLPYATSTPTRQVMEEWAFADRPAGTTAAGFVLHSHHPGGMPAFPQVKSNRTWANVWDLLADMQDLRVIVLERENLLLRHLSQVLAARTGQWHSWDRERMQRVSFFRGPPAADQIDRLPTKAPTLELDPDLLELDFTHIEERRSFVRERLGHLPTLRVSYEEMCLDFNPVCSRVQEFLAVQVMDLATAVAKLERRKPGEAISNHPELQRRFADTRWARFFSE